MTTIRRKWNIAPIALGLFLIFASTKAHAEEDAVYQQPQAAQQQVKPQTSQAYDQQYKLPPSYNGKYYPNDETAIGYHGTSNSAQNENNNSGGHNGSYYYYYY